MVPSGRNHEGEHQRNSLLRCLEVKPDSAGLDVSTAGTRTLELPEDDWRGHEGSWRSFLLRPHGSFCFSGAPEMFCRFRPEVFTFLSRPRPHTLEHQSGGLRLKNRK